MYLPLFRRSRAWLQESDLATPGGGRHPRAGCHTQRNVFIRSDHHRGMPSLLLIQYDAGVRRKIVNAWFEQRYHAPADDAAQSWTPRAAKFNRLMATLRRGSPTRRGPPSTLRPRTSVKRAC